MTRAEYILCMVDEDFKSGYKEGRAKAQKDFKKFDKEYSGKKKFTQKDVDKSAWKGGGAVGAGLLMGKGARDLRRKAVEAGGWGELSKEAKSAMKRKLGME